MAIGGHSSAVDRSATMKEMPGEVRKFDVIVLGAGAAGMMCAAVAGQRGRRVLLLEHNAQAGPQDPHLGGRPLQLHQHPLHAGELHFRESALREVGAGALPAAALS